MRLADSAESVLKAGWRLFRLRVILQLAETTILYNRHPVNSAIISQKEKEVGPFGRAYLPCPKITVFTVLATIIISIKIDIFLM